jgi:hypothetical protein
MLFEHSYNRLADLMLGFVAVCEKEARSDTATA